MCYPPAPYGLVFHEKLLPGLRLGNLHQPIPPTLLGCLDDSATQPLQGIFHGLGHTAFGFQRDKSRDAQLDQLLDEPFLPIALGQRHAQGHGRLCLAVDFLAAGNCQFDLAATCPLDDGIELPARTVKERNASSHLAPHHVQKMMGLGAGEDGAVGRDRRFNKIAIGHGRRWQQA